MTIVCPLPKKHSARVISGFRREVAEKCALLGCYAASSGYLVPTFRDNLSAPSLKVAKRPCTLKMGHIDCPETSVRNYHYSLRNNAEEPSSQAQCFFVGMPRC